MKHTEKEILDRVIEQRENKVQLLQCLEEMAELQKEIVKNINRGQDNIEAIIDEVSDVEIMLRQVKMIYGIEEAVQNHIPEKLERLEERLEW